MDENEKQAIRAEWKLSNHLLVWKSTGKRVARVAVGWVELRGRLWRSRDVIAVLMEGYVDRRLTPSFELARALPGMVIGRNDARLLGMTIYRTGRPCFLGHASWRFVSSGACVACRGLLK